MVKLESSQCSYLRGIRAAVIKEAARARSWQSQRATRRSASEPSRGPETDETVFHPVPSHSGQTSAGALITKHPELRFINLTVPHEEAFMQALRRSFCVHPVQAAHLLWNVEEKSAFIAFGSGHAPVKNGLQKAIQSQTSAKQASRADFHS